MSYEPLEFPVIYGDAATMTKTQWLQARQAGIGGSDTGAILGISPWASPYTLWLTKTAKVPVDKEINSAMSFGTYMEPWIADQLAEQLGVELIDDDLVYQHPEHDFMLANLDRRIGSEVVVEIKTARYNWDEVPPYYYSQVQHYMAVTGLTMAIVAVLFGDQFYDTSSRNVTTFEVLRDDKYIAELIEKEAAFWDCVTRRIQPEVDGSKATYDAIRKSWTAENGKSVELHPSMQHLISQRESLKQALEAQEESLREVESKIMAYMQDAEIGMVGDKKVLTWKPVTTHRVDSKALREAYPDIAAQFTKPNTYRSLRISKWPTD